MLIECCTGNEKPKKNTMENEEIDALIGDYRRKGFTIVEITFFKRAIPMHMDTKLTQDIGENY